MHRFRLSKSQLAFVVVATLYFLWLSCFDWLNHFWTLLRNGSDAAVGNYILFYLFHSVGIVVSSVWMYRKGRASSYRMKLLFFLSIVLTTCFTGAMTIAGESFLPIVCLASGFFGGFLPALLSYNAYLFKSRYKLGYTLGTSYFSGYFLHFLLFITIFPEQEGTILYIKTAIVVLSILMAGVLLFFVPLFRNHLWISLPHNYDLDISNSKRIKPIILVMLLILLFLFSVIYSSQSFAATSVWLNEEVNLLTYTRVFLLIGLFLGGILSDKTGRYFVVSASFSLLAIGLLAMMFAYKGILGFFFFSCAQLSAGLFHIFAWYTFIDIAKYFKKSEIISSLSLAVLFVFKQIGFIAVSILVKVYEVQIVGVLIFIGSLILIAISIPLASKLFYLLGNMFVIKSRDESIEAVLEGGEIAVVMNSETEEPIDTYNNHLNEFMIHYHLSKRGMQVLELSLKGFSNAEIAENLGISERTVKYHISQNLQKTDTNTQKQLISLVINKMYEND